VETTTPLRLTNTLRLRLKAHTTAMATPTMTADTMTTVPTVTRTMTTVLTPTIIRAVTGRPTAKAAAPTASSLQSVSWTVHHIMASVATSSGPADSFQLSRMLPPAMTATTINHPVRVYPQTRRVMANHRADMAQLMFVVFATNAV